MKKLFLLTLTLFLFGCDPVEQDTRLLCDCDSEYDVYGKNVECRDDPSFKNASLVFNESNERFVFNKYKGGGGLASEFKKEVQAGNMALTINIFISIIFYLFIYIWFVYLLFLLLI